MSSPVVIPDFDEDDTTITNPFPVRRRLLHSSFIAGTQTGGQLRSNAAIALKRDREREGRCAECGIQTHGIQNDSYHHVPIKVPLTIENEVYRGRCLLCFPLRASETQEPSSSTTSAVDLSSQTGSTSIQTEGCHSRSGPLTFGHSCMEDDESTDIIDRLYIMRQYPLSEAVQEWGCEGLWVHSWDDETSSAIGRIGGVTRILDAMSRFPHNEHLQHCACEALQNLAVNSFNRNTIVDCGGAALIVQAMMRHFDSVDIQQCGCIALTSLAASPELREDIVRAGGAHAIIHAARKYGDGDSIRCGAFQAVAFQALHALSVDPCRYIIGEGHQ